MIFTSTLHDLENDSTGTSTTVKKSRKVNNESKEVLDYYGGLIKQYRIASPLKVKEICAQVKISKAQLNQWENGKAEPRLHSMLVLCKVLNIPLDELLRIETGELTNVEVGFLQLFRDMNPAMKAKAIPFFKEFLNLFSDPVFGKKYSSQLANESDPEEPVVKRGRGRPRKVQDPSSIVENKQPRKRGRPRKTSVETPVNVIPKKRGRPKKNQTPVTGS